MTRQRCSVHRDLASCARRPWTRTVLFSPSTWRTYTDHLSPTRASTSRAWQFAGVCSSSAGRFGDTGVVLPIGYSEVSEALSCAFYYLAKKPHTLRVVTNSNRT